MSDTFPLPFHHITPSLLLHPSRSIGKHLTPPAPPLHPSIPRLQVCLERLHRITSTVGVKIKLTHRLFSLVSNTHFGNHSSPPVLSLHPPHFLHSHLIGPMPLPPLRLVSSFLSTRLTANNWTHNRLQINRPIVHLKHVLPSTPTLSNTVNQPTSLTRSGQTTEALETCKSLLFVTKTSHLANEDFSAGWGLNGRIV